MTFAIGIVFVSVPDAAVPFTVTLIVQMPSTVPTLAGTPALPLSVIVPAPAVAVRLPPQLVEAFGVGAMTTPPGSVSVRLKFVRATRFWLSSVIVKTDKPFWLIVDG